jgi:S-adenosyl-L-methionine hydrolase (adenosine-forming)
MVLRFLRGQAGLRTRRPIVFVTDYGRDDAYASALVGAAWRIDPFAICVEGTHGVPPGDVLAGAYYLKSLALAFDRQTVLCAVVDPGVGTDRRAIAVEVERARCVGPDNGLISYLWRESPSDSRRAVQLDIPGEASMTFHGRDVFAPAAAQLASGLALYDCGYPIDDPLLLEGAFATPVPGGFRGDVVVVDHFGNAITTVRDLDLRGRAVRRVTWEGGGTDQWVSTYAGIETGIAGLIGSAGHVEIAARGQPAATAGGPQLHQAVTVEVS